MAFSTGLAAGCDQAGERIAHVGKFVNPLLQVIDSAASHRPGFVARIGATLS